MDANDIIIDRILGYEGGYVNHPSDRGGPTNRGVTAATLASWRGHPVTTAEVAALGRDEAIAICKKRFIDVPGFGEIADLQLRGLMVDWGWASGPGIAARGLQRAVNAVMGRTILTVDGVIGPNTLSAVHTLDGDALWRHVVGQRLRQTFRLVTDHPEQAAFAAGWANRIADYIENQTGG
nr:conserved uncharacterized protein [uncultured bacterium]